MEVSTLLVKPIARLTQLMFLAITVLIYSVIAMAIANSLFVTHIGAQNLPLAFILIGLCSFPAYAIFSQIIDRYSRPQLFRYILIISIFIILGLRFLLTFDHPAVYYLLLIAVFFQWDFHNNILYPGLLTDYFTSLEYKRYAPYLGIAQAVGTMLGGGITIVLSNYFKTRDLLFCLPIVFIISFWQLIYLENSQRRLDNIATSPKIGIIESIKSFPEIVKRYPIVLFLASSSFLLVIIYISSEFLWFNIYSQYFSEEELTSFLGLMRIVISLVQVIVLYVIIRPLLTKLGVAKMNTVYPLTTLASFCGLLLNFGLGTGITLQLNGDALYKAVNLPVHQLNYNSIPQEFIGRVRTLSDGIIYSVGLTLAGVILWFCHLYLSLIQITWLAMGLTIILLLIRLPMGKYYAQGLEDMIRSDTIYLDEFSLLQQTKLPPQSNIAIRELLSSDNRYVQLKGLELASKLDNQVQFLPEVEQLLLTGESSLRQEVIRLFSQSSNEEETIDIFNNLLHTSTNSVLKATALEILIINQDDFSDDKNRINLLLQDSDSQIKILAGVAIVQNDRFFSEETITTAWKIIKESSLSEETIKAIIRIIIYTHPNYQSNLSPIAKQLGLPKKGFFSSFVSGFNAPEFDKSEHQLLEFVQEILPQASLETKQEALEGLSTITTNDNRDLVQLALQEITHEKPEVRIAAFKLLASNPDSIILPHLKTGLVDNQAQVRRQVAKTLTVYGQEGLAVAKENLSSNQKPVVDTAIWAIAQFKTRQANDILFQYLTPKFEQLNRTRKWQEQIPQNDPHWQLLAIAINDFHQRLITQVLDILSCLGYSRTVDAVTRILTTNNQKDLANAVELLVSLRHRRFVLPLVPLLEKIVQPELTKSEIQVNPKWLRKKGYNVLLEALESKQRWITIGALTALAMIPSTLLQDSDQIVRSIASQMFPNSTSFTSPNNLSMNRLLLLKNVALFKNLSLDELFLIDQALEQQQVLSDEVIYTEGSWGEYLYIIAQGKVRIVKKIDDEEKEIRVLSEGQYFGEIALFDNATRWDGTIAIEDCTLLKLEKKRFISLITQRPHIILEICRFLSQRLRETDKYISQSKKVITESNI